MSKHTCHAKGCPKACAPRFLMCSICWSKVSKKTQIEVYRYYTKGQCNNANLIKKEWLVAARKAIMEVSVG